MAETITMYEVINPDTCKTLKYKITISETGKYFKVSKYTRSFLSDYSTIKEFLESEQSAFQIIMADAFKTLGNTIRINKIKP
ncbi:MAG: hypothetical protein IPN09_02095 [Bacteroidetes bacterium]|nr:hypothetical protein [Bacteroidota bacterium]